MNFDAMCIQIESKQFMNGVKNNDYSISFLDLIPSVLISHYYAQDV